MPNKHSGYEQKQKLRGGQNQSAQANARREIKEGRTSSGKAAYPDGIPDKTYKRAWGTTRGNPKPKVVAKTRQPMNPVKRAALTVTEPLWGAGPEIGVGPGRKAAIRVRRRTKMALKHDDERVMQHGKDAKALRKAYRKGKK